MELWERSAALEALEDLVRASANGGRVALVAGEAGMGKSALVGEFARRLGSRARLLWGGCDQLVTPRALGPLHDMAREAGGTLAARMRAAEGQEDIFSAFLDEMSAPRQVARPVVVVEDAHWADEGTLDWLIFLGRRIERLSALLVVTYRDDEVGPDHPLRRALAALPSGAVQRVQLAPLSAACVAEAAREAGRDADGIRQLAGGNPLLVTELLRAHDLGVPAAVQDLILARMHALPGPARGLAQLVAVVPTRADPPLLVGSAEAAETCLGAGVLIPAGDGVSFRHELLRNAVEASLSPTWRTELHRRALALLSVADGVDPGRLVHHASGAGDTDAILQWGQRAGQAAARQGAHREAARHLTAAVAYADRLDEPARAELLESYALEAYLAGDPESALPARRRAQQLRQGLDQPDQVSENLRWISRLSWWTGRTDDARQAAREAVAVLDGRPETAQLGRAYANLGQVHITAHEFAEAVHWGTRAVAVAEGFGDVWAADSAGITLGSARLAQGDDSAAADLERIHASSAARGDVETSSRAVTNLALMAADEQSDFAAAVPVLERALAYNREHERWGQAWMLVSARAKLRLELGDWPGAERDAEDTLAAFGNTGVNAILSLVARGRIQAARGEEAAWGTLAEARAAAEAVGDLPTLVPVWDALAESHLLAGDREQAYEVASRALEAAGGEHGTAFLTGRLAWRMWCAGAPAEELPHTVAAPFRMMTDGRWSAAAAEWRRRGGRYLEAAALGTGDEEAAYAALRILDGLGATRAAEVLRADLRGRGFTRIPRGPRRATAEHEAGLTPRQSDVLALIADGLTNDEIARRLHLSAKTVDHHVSAVLAKLGVGSRGQAAVAAHRRGWVAGRTR